MMAVHPVLGRFDISAMDNNAVNRDVTGCRSPRKFNNPCQPDDYPHRERATKCLPIKHCLRLFYGGPVRWIPYCENDRTMV